MTQAFWQTLGLTFKLALITTVALSILGLPLAYYLARSRRGWKPVLEALVSMPLVLPPHGVGLLFTAGL